MKIVLLAALLISTAAYAGPPMLPPDYFVI